MVQCSQLSTISWENIFSNFKSWLRSNFCKVAAFVSVLVFGYDLVRYSILSILITFFTDKRIKYRVVKAAKLAILLDGVSGSLEIVVAYMLDAHFSNLMIISCSFASTIIGLVLFTLNLMKRRGRYEFVYIVGIFLLAVGEGVRPQLNVFLADQLRGHGPVDTNTNEVQLSDHVPVDTNTNEDQLSDHVPVDTNTNEDQLSDIVPVDTNTNEDQLSDHVPVDTNTNKDPVKVRKRVWLIVAWLCSVVATFFISPFSWKITFFSSTSVLVVTFILFLCGIPFYHRKEFTGTGSSLFNFIPVVKAFWLKKHLPYPPSSSSDYYFYGPDNNDHQNQEHLSPQVNGPDNNDHQNQEHLSPQVKNLRWLDKAAIIEQDQEEAGAKSQQDQKEARAKRQQEAGRLCTVEQVKETKLLLKMIPMWSTFLVIGLVSSTGDTFSSQQGDELDAPIGFMFYVVFFLKHISKAMISYLFDKFLSPKRVPETRYKQAKILRIWIGMVLCTIFCAIAWRVEVGRLHKNITGLFWLAPQYCLLGLMLGFSADGLDKFMIDELPESLQNYASAMNGFVIDGLGSFLSILFMHANRNIFGFTLDDSRLDTYYMILMIISFLNVCYYCLISTIYCGSTHSLSTS